MNSTQLDFLAQYKTVSTTPSLLSSLRRKTSSYDDVIRGLDEGRIISVCQLNFRRFLSNQLLFKTIRSLGKVFKLTKQYKQPNLSRFAIKCLRYVSLSFSCFYLSFP